MRIDRFPFCCTATIIMGFSQSAVAERDWDGPKATSVEAVEEYIKHHIIAKKAGGESMLTAITNSEQTYANQALLNLGFSHSLWMEKPNHHETKLRLWYIDVQKFSEVGTVMIREAKL